MGLANVPEVLEEALLSIYELLSPQLLAGQQRDEQAILQTLLEHAEEHDVSLIKAASLLGIPFPLPVAAISLESALRTWYTSGAQSVIFFKDLIDLYGTEGRSEEKQLFIQLLDAAEALAQWHLGHPFSIEELHRDASRGLRAAAHIAENNGQAESALKGLRSAARLLEPYANGRSLVVWDEACRLAQRLGHEEIQAEIEALRAKYIVELATQGHMPWLVASRAVERILRKLPSNIRTAQQVLPFLWPMFIQHKELQPLLIWLQFIVRRSDAPTELEKAVEGMEDFLHLRFKGTTDELLNRVHQLAKLVGMIEDENLTLEPTEENHTAQADWVSWSFRHTAYRRAVISGESLLRERDLDQILLVMNHELTHMYCMGSGVGAAVNALTAAMVEREADLHDISDRSMEKSLHRWSEELHGQGQEPDELPELPSLAELPNNALALAKAEQVLELGLKIAAVKEVWEPWFEGIAILAETAADPADDPDMHAGPVPVILNLVDRFPSSEALNSEDAKSFILKQMADYEELYGRALQTAGCQRLVAYCMTYRTLYLSGVLAVRAAMAAWRSRLGRPITGAQCSRILLDYTRSSTWESIPDLALPLDRFREELLAKMHAFYVQVCSISAKDLSLVLEGTSQRRREAFDYTWSRGNFRPSTEPQEFRMDASPEGILDAALKAQSSLTDGYADLDRVSDADIACQEAMLAAAQILADAESNTELVQAQVNSAISLSRVLPLGEVEAPFWLVPDCHGVLVIFRTTECNRDSGSSSYNSELISLGEEKFAQLEQEVLEHGESRLRLYRVADLIPSGYIDGQGYGRNYIALRYGEWLYIRAKGLSIGTRREVDPVVFDAIHERVMDYPLTRFAHSIVAHGAPGARRTLDWLQETPKLIIGNHKVDLEPWAARVRTLCQQILNPELRQERREASMCLLNLVFDDATLSQRIEEQGLEALREKPGAKITEAVRLLHESARLPQESPTAEVIAHSWRLFEHKPWGWDMVAPVIRRSSAQ